mgnify:CR=1 FL=1
MLFSLCAVVSACSDENDKGTSTATLEIVEEFVDFKENGESQTIVITTNQAEWSATVESNGKGGAEFFLTLIRGITNLLSLLPPIREKNSGARLLP